MLAAAYSTVKYKPSLKSRCFNSLRLILESSSWSGSNISRSISTAHHGFDYMTKIMRKEPPEIDYLDYGLTRDCTQGDYQTFCEKFLMESEPTIEDFLKVFLSTPTVYNPEFLQKSQSELMLLEDRILKDEQQISKTLPFKALSDLSFKEYQIKMEEIPKAEMLKLIAQEYKNFKELFLQNPNGAGYITKGQMITTLIDPNALKNCRAVNTEADVTHQFQSKLMTPIENVFELSGYSNVSIDQFYGIPLRDPKRTRYTKRADFGFVDNQLKRNLIIGKIEHHFDSLENELQAGAKELSKESLESITQCVRYCALSHCEYGVLTSLTETLLIQIDYDNCNYRTDDDIIKTRYYYLKNMDEKVTMKALMMSILMKQLKNTKSDNAQVLAYRKERSENFLNFSLKSDRQFESDFQDMKNELTLKMKPIGETFTVCVDKSSELSVDKQVLTFKIRKSDLISDTPDKAEETIVRIFDPMTMNSPYNEIIDNIDFSRNCYLSELESQEYLDGSSANRPIVVEKGFIIIRDRLNNNVLASVQFIAYGDQPSPDIYSKQNIS